MLWSSSHYLKFSFATEKFTVGLKHINYCSDQFTFLSSSIEVCFRPFFYRFMKSINYLYGGPHPSRSSITNAATLEFIRVPF